MTIEKTTTIVLEAHWAIVEDVVEVARGDWFVDVKARSSRGGRNGAGVGVASIRNLSCERAGDFLGVGANVEFFGGGEGG